MGGATESAIAAIWPRPFDITDGYYTHVCLIPTKRRWRGLALV